MPMAATSCRAISTRPEASICSRMPAAPELGPHLEALERHELAIARADAQLQLRAADFDAEKHGAVGRGQWLAIEVARRRRSL